MADNQVTVEQLLRGLGQAVLQLSEKMDVLVEKLDGVREEVAKTTPMAPPGESFLEAQFGRVESALAVLGSREVPEVGAGASDQLVRGLAELETSIGNMSQSMGEKLDGIAAGIAGNQQEKSAPELRDEIVGLGDRLEKVLGEVNTAVRETGEQSAMRISEASGVIVEAIGALPDSVKAMKLSLEEKADALRAETAENQRNTEKTLESIEKTEKKTVEAVEAVKKELSEGLKNQKKLLGEMQEVTERFAGKAMEDGISQLNRSAIHHYNIGEYNAALEDLKEAAHLDGNRAEIWCNMAHVQAALKEDTDAEASFRKALELQPDLDQAVSGLGVLLLAGGRSEESISFLEGFIGEETSSIRTMIAYSRALAAAGRHSDAVNTLERAASLAPENPEVRDELAAYTGDGKS
jgi:Flp pilus assembly protein TadD